MKSQLVAGIAVGPLTFFTLSAMAEIGNPNNDSCMEASVAELIAENSHRFKGSQIGIVCGISKLDVTENRCEREKNEKEFTYNSPTGFRITASEFRVQTKSKYATVGDVSFDDGSATVTLQCIGRPCDIPGHELVRGNIVGDLQYQPSLDDMIAIKDECGVKHSE